MLFECFGKTLYRGGRAPPGRREEPDGGYPPVTDLFCQRVITRGKISLQDTSLVLPGVRHLSVSNDAIVVSAIFGYLSTWLFYFFFFFVSSMARRYRRRFKRRFRRRYRRSRRYRKKAGRPNNRPWGKVTGNPFHGPRSNKCFMYPMKRTACFRSTCSFSMTNPINAQSATAGVAAAGFVARWALNPFHWVHPYKYQATDINTSIGLTALQAPRYRFHTEVERDFSEYSPVKAYYSIVVRQLGGNNDIDNPNNPTIGCFITGRNAPGSSALVTPVWDGTTSHTEIDTWKAFPGNTYYTQSRTNASNSTIKAKRFSGVVKASDFQGNRVISGGGNETVNAANNWFPWTIADTPGTFPQIYIWYGNPNGVADQDYEIQVRMTLMFKVRKMSNLDPLKTNL